MENDKDIQELIASNLRSFLDLHNIPQRKVALAIGVSPQQFSRYCSGKDAISSVNLYKISKVLDITLSFFVRKHLDI